MEAGRVGVARHAPVREDSRTPALRPPVGCFGAERPWALSWWVQRRAAPAGLPASGGECTEGTPSAPHLLPLRSSVLPVPGRQSPGKTPSAPSALLRAPAGCRSPLARSPPSSFSRAVFGSSGRPALHPLSPPHNGQCGAGVAGRAGPGLSRVARQPGIRLGFCSAAVAMETEQQRGAGRAAGWGWGPPGGGGA